MLGNFIEIMVKFHKNLKSYVKCGKIYISSGQVARIEITKEEYKMSKLEKGAIVGIKVGKEEFSGMIEAVEKDFCKIRFSNWSKFN